MYRAQILLEPEQHRLLSEIARRENRSMSEVVREMLQKQLEAHQKQVLAQAAEILIDDYKNDPELTEFHSLDGEDFYAQR
jgi:hypothetical protein